nr:septal ring lytic transglycosylase RlpA family protein [Romeria gracilis]
MTILTLLGMTALVGGAPTDRAMTHQPQPELRDPLATASAARPDDWVPADSPADFVQLSRSSMLTADSSSQVVNAQSDEYLMPHCAELPAEVDAPLKASTNRLEGTASWYGPYFHGRLTATGEIFDQNELTVAHKTLPFGTLLKVRNLLNDRMVIVRVNDRGPYVGDRSLDLSRAAAECLDSTQVGLIPYEAVLLKVSEPSDGSIAIGRAQPADSQGGQLRSAKTSVTSRRAFWSSWFQSSAPVSESNRVWSISSRDSDELSGS